MDFMTTELTLDELKAGVPFTRLFLQSGLVTSLSEARRLIEQGGAYVNGQKVMSIDEGYYPPGIVITWPIELRAGKKRYHWITIER